MRFEIVLGLISTFQIYHQALSNSLAMPDFGFSVAQLSLISAVFPIGKFFGTVSIVLLFKKNYLNRQCLDYAVGILLIGSLLMLIPSFIILCASRFIIGVGVGMAFISAFVALTDLNTCAGQSVDFAECNFLTRQENCQVRQLSAFFSTAILFAAGIFFVNLSVFLHFSSKYAQIWVFAFPAIFSGLNYFYHRNAVHKQLPSLSNTAILSSSDKVLNYDPEFINTLKLDKLSKQWTKSKNWKDNCFPNTTNVAQPKKEQIAHTPHMKLAKSHHNYDINDIELRCSPFALAIILMSINASIGVPIILAYSSIIYRTLGISQQNTIYLSSLYPLIQLGVMVAFRQLTNSYNNLLFSKRTFILVGYGICLALSFFLLLTLQFETLNTSPVAKRISSSFWFTMLTIVTALPCSVGVAAISTDIFPNRSALIQGMAKSRAFFWVFSSILCGVFLHILESKSLFFAFLPCFCASILAYGLLYLYFPKRFHKNKLSIDNSCYSFSNISLKYGAVADFSTIY